MIDDMTDQPITVPSGPYFHGTRRRLEIGQQLLGGIVDPALGDDRLMVWANTDVRSAFQRVEKRYRELESTASFEGCKHAIPEKRAPVNSATS